VPTLADGTTAKYVPVAVPEKWVDTNGVTTADDYFEMAAVEYTEKVHTDLRKATTFRGYVQLETARNPAPVATRLPLTYPDGTPILIQDTNPDGSLKFDNAGNKVLKQAVAMDSPHYMGPVLNATKGVATRIKLLNLLPVGRAVLQRDAAGAPVLVKGQVQVTQRNGDLFVPVDSSLEGAGTGPDGNRYTQNRISPHVLGSDAPWMSAGSPHQWVAALGEEDPARSGSLASQIIDPLSLSGYLKGASVANVPDMYDPGAGSRTLYFPNQQNARFMWIQDSANGMARLNTYVGLVAPMMLTDAVEQDLIARKVIPGPAETIPIVLQDKSFVPDDIALQDARWNTTAWGAPGDLWMTHVYETLQDPAQQNGSNKVGRWLYGPWFWPIYPAQYVLPTGAYGNETMVPEVYSDTPVINGVAYPYVDVEPKAYRLRIANGAVDRSFSFSLFEADPNPVMSFPLAGATEVKMVPAALPAVQCANGETRWTPANPCTPFDWPTDARSGGVPDPTLPGPTLYQFGSDGGLLPQVATVDPLPTNPLYDKGRITVLNVATTGLWLAPGERADLVVDFSPYAGKTLIAYNDMFSPVPAGDNRDDYSVGIGDRSPNGGAEDSKPGFGPNTRTLMQFRVKAAVTTAGIPFNAAAPALAVELPKSYAGMINGAATVGAAQARPIVAQSAYNAAFNPTGNCPAVVQPNTAGCWDDVMAYSSIYAGTTKQPLFSYVPGNPSLFSAIQVTAPGLGYVTAPTVTFSGGGATTPATGVASLKIASIIVTNPGSGYTTAPLVTIAVNNGVAGGGAQASSKLLVNNVAVVNPGSGYITAPAVTFALPPKGGVQTQGVAVVSAGKVTGITITNPGSGYDIAPAVSIAAPPLKAGNVRATAKATGGVSSFVMVPTDPTNPTSTGGMGYSDMTQVLLTLTTPTAVGGVVATGTPVGAVYDVNLTDPGVGYKTAPTITITGGGGAGAAAQVLPSNQATATVQAKAEQELHEATYGRTNTTLGVELAFVNAGVQTTIPLNFLDPASEVLGSNEMQVWKLVHNGLYSQVLGFDGMEVQLINRVGWDNFIEAPFPNEVGWKDSIRVHPLSDAIVALRPKKPTMPGFGLPLSNRRFDPTQVLGSSFGFTQLALLGGGIFPGLPPAATVNQVASYGWEFTWGNRVLSHAENDMRRPVVINGVEAVPVAPSALAATVPAFTPGTPYAGITLSWTDNSTTEYQQIVQRATGATGTVFKTIATLPANKKSFVDSTVEGGTVYRYQVVAVGSAGSSASPILNAAATPTLPPAAPSALSVSQATATTMQVQWTDNSTNETNFVLEASANGGAYAAVPSSPFVSTTTASTGTFVTLPNVGLAGATGSITYRVAANNTLGNANYNSAFTYSSPIALNAVPNAPTTLAAAAVSETQVDLSWTDSSNNEAGFVVQMSDNGGAFTQIGTVLLSPGMGTRLGFSALVSNGHNYVFRVAAQSFTGIPSPWLTSAVVPVSFLPAQPSNLTTTLNSATQIALGWTDASNNETSFLPQVSANAGVTWTSLPTVAAVAGSGTTLTTNFVPAMGNAYLFRINAVNAAGMNASQVSLPVVMLPTMSGLAGTSTAPTTATLTWVDGGPLETGYKVERSVAGTTVWTLLGTTVANATTYTATVLLPNTAYNFRVTPVAVAGLLTRPGASMTIPVTTQALPSAPTGLTVTPVAPVAPATTPSANLSWVDASVNETSYQVQRCNVVAPAVACLPTSVWTTVGTVLSTTSAATGTVVSWPNAGLVTKAKYSYRIVPLIGTVAGTASAIVTATMP
jgi:FtsP/CotA-like multicopper oxidase with cupredoxin domain